MLRVVTFLLASAALAGCQSALVSETGPLTIRDVDVTAAETFRAETDIATDLERRLDEAITGLDAAGRDVTVGVELTTMTYKNPLAAALVGSSNRLASEVVVREPSGAEVARFPYSASLDNFPQGILGAVQAAGQVRAEVDDRIAGQYATGLGARIYGDTLPSRRGGATAPVAPAPSVAAGPPTS